MNWYYVENGQQAGPVDEIQLQALVQSGKVQPDTLVWREGMANWAPYSEAGPAPAAAETPPVLGQTRAPGASGGIICSECGRAFAPADVIRYGDKWVCAACKPAFFQRLREGAAFAPGASGATTADLLARDYEVDIGGALSQGWEVFKTNAGPLIGASVLVCLAVIAVNLIPYLSAILALFLNGPLMGGLWAYYIRTVRGQQPTVGEAFSGFGPKFWQLVLTQLIPGLVAVGFVFLFMLLMIPSFIAMAKSGGGQPHISAAFVVPMIIVGVVALVVLTYLNTCWMFGLALAADKGLRFWPALELSRKMVSKHWWMTFLLLMVAGIIGVLGLALCLLPAIITGPIAFAAIATHYEKVFGDLAPES